MPARLLDGNGARTRGPELGQVRFAPCPDDGIGPDELEFVVEPEGSAVVSHARADDWSLERPYVTVLARHRTGKHAIIARLRATGDVVGEATFRVTTSWSRRRRRGPGFWFSSSQGLDAPYAGFGSAWGGGPSGPQNIPPSPVKSPWQIGIVFVDTSSRRFPSGAAARDTIRDLWLDHVDRGTVDNAMTRSVRQFFEEVAYGNFTLSAQSLGFHRPPNAWESYFDADADDASPQGTLIDAAIAAVDDDVDLTGLDTLLIVSPRVPATATTPERAAWPFASIGKHGPYATGDGSVPLAWISCVSDWVQAPGDTREIFETISHELGHNLGLNDQYSSAVTGRNVGSWDLMDWDGTHPHLSIAHRMMLGWVDRTWIEPFDFVSSPGPVGQRVTLQAIETGAPVGDAKAGIEVRIADGVNQYWEFRNDQPAQIGDRELPLEPAVLGTDVMGDTGPAPIPRPQLLLPDHVDDDGAALTWSGVIATRTTRPPASRSSSRSRSGG